MNLREKLFKKGKIIKINEFLNISHYNSKDELFERIEVDVFLDLNSKTYNEELKIAFITNIIKSNVFIEVIDVNKDKIILNDITNEVRKFILDTVKEINKDIYLKLIRK